MYRVCARPARVHVCVATLASGFAKRTGLLVGAHCGSGGDPVDTLRGSTVAMATGVDDTIPVGSKSRLELPQFPGEDFLAHAGTQWLEQAEARLASAGLLAVAEGDDPPSCKSRRKL